MTRKITLSIDESCSFKPDTISVIEYLANNNCNLYYAYDEIFKYLEDRRDLFGRSFDYIENKVGTYKVPFLKDYIENANKNFGYVYPIKLLVDTFMYQPINTVFCLYDGTRNIFDMSKGTKKLIAFDVLGLTNAHILIVSSLKLPNQIKSDEELYWLLRKIDPAAHRFDIIIEGFDEYPRIHYAESVSTIGKWSMMTTKDKDLFNQTMPSLPARVKFIGKAYTTDSRIIECSNDYYCCVYSNKLINISLDYLYLCSSNMFYKQKTRIGTTRDNSVTIEYGWINSYPFGYADFFIPNS